MAAPPCPECQAEGRVLTHPSTGPIEDYYRCDKCGLVWSVPKGADRPVLRYVTRRKPQTLHAQDGVAVRSHRIRRALSRDAERRRLVRHTLVLGHKAVQLINQHDARGLRALRAELGAHRDEFAAFAQRIAKPYDRVLRARR